MKTIVAFDLGRSPFTGVSIWENGELKSYYKFHFKGMSNEDIYKVFDNLLFGKENVMVVYEKNKFVPNGVNTMVSQAELRTMVDCACYVNKVKDIIRFKPIDWRKLAFVGIENMKEVGRDNWKKLAIKEANRIIGSEELIYYKDSSKTDDDIAEAIMIGLACKLKYGR